MPPGWSVIPIDIVSINGQYLEAVPCLLSFSFFSFFPFFFWTQMKENSLQGGEHSAFLSIGRRKMSAYHWREFLPQFSQFWCRLQKDEPCQLHPWFSFRVLHCCVHSCGQAHLPAKPLCYRHRILHHVITSCIESSTSFGARHKDMKSWKG
jgi:hypothetical protein